ncbi:hypothetical protein F1643_05910 [Azospirillum sp. INR13]|uniref:hypothetical protein n=1 Tax=Azospirillum sp. INR13 TaxID=2596919 RepID=UPI00189207E4|nr:hypothetical protein [Azospirillum sp. INR13]MBF5094091.1 hypothetical protein [Azospirillum sp. INR13]
MSASPPAAFDGLPGDRPSAGVGELLLVAPAAGLLDAAVAAFALSGLPFALPIGAALHLALCALVGLWLRGLVRRGRDLRLAGLLLSPWCRWVRSAPPAPW